jgi:hypothetical protein
MIIPSRNEKQQTHLQLHHQGQKKNRHIEQYMNKISLKTGTFLWNNIK